MYGFSEKFGFDEKKDTTVKAVTVLLRNPPENLGGEIVDKVLVDFKDRAAIRDDGVEAARRGVQGLFPFSRRFCPNRRFRAWLDSQLNIVALHAIELTRFHVGLDPRRVDLTKDLRDLIVSYLNKGYRGTWVWERCVQAIAESRRLTANGQSRIAELNAACSLRAYYSYGKPGDKRRWLEAFGEDPASTHEPERIAAIVEFAFEFSARCTLGIELQQELALALELASACGSRTREFLSTACSAVRAPYRTSRLSDDPGVYLLYLYFDDPTPTYVGQGSIRKRVDAHAKAWDCDAGKEMHVAAIYGDELPAPLGHVDAEKILLALLNPPANNGKDVRHPDELRILP